jgi:hypothetical protein
MSFTKCFPRKLFLRQILLYRSHEFDYALIFFNFVLRCLWVVSLFPQSFTGLSNTVYVSLSFAEITRRCLWLILRLEREHISRAHRFRIVDEELVSIHIERNDVISWDIQDGSIGLYGCDWMRLIAHILAACSLILVIIGSLSFVGMIGYSY